MKEKNRTFLYFLNSFPAVSKTRRINMFCPIWYPTNVKPRDNSKGAIDSMIDGFCGSNLGKGILFVSEVGLVG